LGLGGLILIAILLALLLEGASLEVPPINLQEREQKNFRNINP